MAFYEFDHPQLGPVRVCVRQGIRSFKAKWWQGRAQITVPAGVPAEAVERFINEAIPEMLRHRTRPKFEIGTTLRLDGGIEFSFVPMPDFVQGRVYVHPTPTGGVVKISKDLKPGTPETDGMISRLLFKAAHVIAPRVLVPMVEVEAERLGLKPASIAISRGHRVLGHCSVNGEVAISSACLFLPHDLRRYIVCHELAHLTEMNHSPRFHALLNSYLDGGEARLVNALHQYIWPVVK